LSIDRELPAESETGTRFEKGAAETAARYDRWREEEGREAEIIDAADVERKRAGIADESADECLRWKAGRAAIGIECGRGGGSWLRDCVEGEEPQRDDVVMSELLVCAA
jgi:hypothetical protein